MQVPGFVVYTRVDCPLCDDFVVELARLLGPADEPVELRDVDADPAARRRFGRKVPVLTRAGRIVCYGRLDSAAVASVLAD